MSKSFDRNIERLKANQRSVSQQEQTIRTNTAISRGQYEIAHAKDIANKLAPFSSALQDWKDKDIARQKEEGREEHDRDQLARAQWLEEHGTAAQQRLAKLEEAQAAGELAYEIIDTEKQEREIQLLKEQPDIFESVKHQRLADKFMTQGDVEGAKNIAERDQQMIQELLQIEK